MPDTAVMWFRRDLRVSDNAALRHAAESAGAVACLACALEAEDAPRAQAWRRGSLQALHAELAARGNRLAWSSASAPEVVAEVAAEVGARRVMCTRDWTPTGMAEEDAVREKLGAIGVQLDVHEGSLLVEPDRLKTAEGRAYRVYTPYARAWLRAWGPLAPLEAPADIAPPARLWPGEPLPGASGVPLGVGGEPWLPGETGARDRLARFCREGLDGYAADRDVPSMRATSELSPHLAAGDISPTQIAAAVTGSGLPSADIDKFIAELAWREFAASILHAFPDTRSRPLRAEFEAFPWRDDPADLAAWIEGRTGYPIVDAGMRQLAATGWVHNRVRLVVGSFLTKDLLIAWQHGERDFAERLVDFDPASNAFNWQWISGCGADAAPYFRIFNPTLQGQRFDADGAYVRRWVPELGALPSRWIHRPWDAPSEVLREANVALGTTYPHRIVDHREARDRALAAFYSLKESARR